MFSINKTLLIITGVIAAICIAFTSGYSYKSNQIEKATTKEIVKQQENNIKIESKVNDKLIEVVKYKYITIPEKVRNEKINSSDVLTPAGYSVLINDSIRKANSSSESFN